jgi:hypothetical protein
MGRRSLKKSNKFSFSKSIRHPNNIYVINISLNNSFKIIDNSSPEAYLILKSMIITGISMMIMAQITVSALPEKYDYIDKLPSYIDIKKKFITSNHGRSLAAVSGLAASYPWLIQDPSMNDDDCADKIIHIIFDMIDNPSPNSKRIKPSVSDWQLFAKGEISAAFGQILSCPTTNFKTINIEPNISRFGFIEAYSLLGFDAEILNKYNITPELILNAMKTNFLTELSGLPVDSLSYNESNLIYSRIQADILDDKISRTGLVNSKLVKGQEPSSAITRAIIEKYLNPRELIAYNFAINTGDKNILKKYTDMIIERSKKDSE